MDCFQWGQNLELLYDRVLRYPDRVKNLYFTFLFVLRAVTKVSAKSTCLLTVVVFICLKVCLYDDHTVPQTKRIICI